MSYHVLYEACPWHSRAALFDDKGRLLSLRLQDDTRRYTEGCVIWGRVRAVEKGLGGAFVDIGDRVDGFLPFSTLMPEHKKLTEGQALLVRVARGGFDGKGARLDGRVAVKPPAKETPAPHIIQPAPSALTRALHDANANPICCWVPDARLHGSVIGHFSENAIRRMDLEDETEWFERLDTELDVMLSDRPTWPIVGGDVIVEITSAVATIDVNANGATAGVGRTDGLLTVNLAAANEVARLSRLLDLGGSIIVDFITPSVRDHRKLISDHLAAAFETTDDQFVELRPMSRHGLVEITRERKGPSINLLLKRPFAVAGRILLELWRAPASRHTSIHGRRVVCHPDVASLLEQRLTTEVCLAQLGFPVQIEADNLLPIAVYKLYD